MTGVAVGSFDWRARLLIGLLVAVMALMLAACGGGDDDDAGGADGDQTPVATEGGGGDGGDAGDETPAPEGDDDDEATPEPDDGDGDAEIDACALVTADEAEKALGASTSEGVPENVAPFFACSYATDDLDQLTVAVVIYPGADDAKAAYEMVVEINDYPEIDGLGDRAYDTRPLGDITVQRGKYELSVDIYSSADDDFDAAVDLAKKALGRLP